MRPFALMRSGVALLVAVAFVVPVQLAEAMLIVPSPDRFPPVPNLTLTLAYKGVPIVAGSTADLPTGQNDIISVSVSASDLSILDGSAGSPVSQNAFYLDFYKGVPFSGATFISGEQMNAATSTLKDSSMVRLPGPGTYSAVLYSTWDVRDYDTMCPELGSCAPQMSAGLTREAIKTWPEDGSQHISYIGIVTFTIPDPCADSACLSNVLFLPGIEASRLYMRDASGSERQLWEPSIASDIPWLAMRADGTSVNQVYTKDAINSIYGNVGLGGLTYLKKDHFEVYGDFARFMDSLVASSTLRLNAWRAYPYDWRYDVRDIVDDGTLTEMPDGSLKRVYLEDMLADLAAGSQTGKVTIIAHSNGGLLAKALLARLAREGKSDLVDRLVMIGTPQWGTPSDIGTMLHGEGGTHLLGIVSYGSDIRVAAATMPGAYGLLPSPAYFAHVGTPVATFADDDIAGPFRDAFPGGITSFEELLTFITDGLGRDAAVGDASKLNTPLALPRDMAESARMLHDGPEGLDAWVPPAGTQVTSIVGWGQLTTSGYAYASTFGHFICTALLGQNICSRENKLVHTAVKTEDGDDTVVAPSAAGDVGEVWYFDAENFQNDKKVNIVHQDLTSATPIQNAVLDLLRGKSVSEDYILDTKPLAIKNPLIRIGGMSPVNVVATDAAGEATGIVPVPGTSGIYFALHDIPGSAVDISGEEKFVYLPQGGQYSVTVDGYDAGPANIEVQSLDASGSPTQTTTLADIPVTASTVAIFSVDPSTVLSSVAIDTDGDGVTDATMTPQAGGMVSYAPPAPPAPAPSAAGGGAGESPLKYLSVISPPAAPAPAPAAVVAPSTVLATTVPAAVTTEPEIAAATVSTPEKREMRAAPPVRPGAPARATASANAPHALAQTAAVGEALSEPRTQQAASSVYHWLQDALSSLLHAIMDIL